MSDIGFQLINLSELNLAQNQIRTVGKLTGYPNIKTLRLNRNPITEIDARAFQDCKSLKDLDISRIELPNYQGDLRFLRFCTELEVS